MSALPTIALSLEAARAAEDRVADVVGHNGNAAGLQGVERAPRIALEIENGQAGNPCSVVG
jgi:hypothetical protein